MRWLVLLALVMSSAVFAAPPRAHAQQSARTARVGFLGNVPPSNFEAFRAGLRELGYKEGQNLVIERRVPDTGEQRLTDLATELVALKVDVIIAPGSVSRIAAQRSTATIPIVTIGGMDPVREGWAQALARPGGNVTGFAIGATTSAESGAKWLELLKQGSPSLRRVAVLRDANVTGWDRSLSALQGPAKSLGIHLDGLPVRGPGDLAGAVAEAARLRAGAVIVWTSPMLHVHQPAIVELVTKHRLPSIAPFADFAEMGGLMAYGPNLNTLWGRAATYVDRILKGANPAEMPVELPTRPELILNLKTAKRLGLAIPPSLRLRADRMIE